MNAMRKEPYLERAHGGSRICSFAVLVTLTLFVALRGLYWLSIDEQPFSDMADYHSIAQGVWNSFTFDHNSFWRSYKPPGMPLLAAPIVGPFPGDFGLWLWRILLAGVTFVSALFLAGQLGFLCRTRWAGVAFLLIVSMSKSSIFWSYRFSTESLTEAVTYLVLGAYLWFVRDVHTKTVWHAAMLGAVSILLALIRPNMMPVLAIVPAGFAMRGLQERPRLYSRILAYIVAYTVGVVILWTPWLYRGFNLYGELVPFSTQGPYSFLWEAGGFSYSDPELGIRNVNADILQAEAPMRFKTDKEAANLASLAGKQWLQQLGYAKFGALVFQRMGVMIERREITLSKTPRASLFSSPLDGFLIDKSLALVSVALMGIFWGTVVLGIDFLVFGVFLFGPIVLSACFMGEPRMLEPMLPLISFSAVVGVAVGLVFLLRIVRRINLMYQSS